MVVVPCAGLSSRLQESKSQKKRAAERRNNARGYEGCHMAGKETRRTHSLVVRSAEVGGGEPTRPAGRNEKTERGGVTVWLL